jgi:hypothetical protein
VNGQPVKFTPAQSEQIFSLLKGPMMLGFAGAIDVSALAQPSAPSAKQLLDAGGMFVILDVTGKTAQFDLLFRLIAANVSKEIAHTHVDFSGVGVEKFSGPNNTSFATRVGNYFVWSNREKVIQDLATRLGSRSAPADSLAQNSGYQSCRGNPDPDSIYEIYFRFPDLTKTSIPPNAQFDTSAALRSLKLDSLRAVCGSYSFTQQGAHSRGILLGDTGAGGIFDFFGANRSHFDTLALAPASAYSYTSYSFDLPAIYKTVRTAAMAALPAQQAAMVAMVEGMSAMQTGMPLPDVLALAGGEIASIQLDPHSTPPSQMYAISITNSEKVALLFHKLGGDSIVEDSFENGITIFKSKSAAIVADAKTPLPPTTYYVVAPHFLLYGTDKQALSKAAQLDSAAGSSLADKPEISKLRANLPHDLLGMIITDYSHYDWATEITKTFNQAENADKGKLSPEDIQFFAALKKFSASSPGKTMLHASVDGWWKASDGIHYEGFDQ